jgi:cytochrome c
MKTLHITKPILLAVALVAPALAGANQELAQAKNCLACHQVEAKVVGPAFKDIAAKYSGDSAAADTLAEKVKAGGVGNWGQIPMPPNPAVSDDEAKQLVEWILSL